MKTFKEFIAEKALEVETEAEEIVETEVESDEYKAYFAKMLKKFKVENPSELEGDEKKKFFDAVDAGWEAEEETDED